MSFFKGKFLFWIFLIQSFNCKSAFTFQLIHLLFYKLKSFFFALKAIRYYYVLHSNYFNYIEISSFYSQPFYFLFLNQFYLRFHSLQSKISFNIFNLVKVFFIPMRLTKNHWNDCRIKLLENEWRISKSLKLSLILLQDLFVDRLVEKVEKLQDDIAMFNAQYKLQVLETKNAKNLLHEAELQLMVRNILPNLGEFNLGLWIWQIISLFKVSF